MLLTSDTYIAFWLLIESLLKLLFGCGRVEHFRTYSQVLYLCRCQRSFFVHLYLKLYKYGHRCLIKISVFFWFLFWLDPRLSSYLLHYVLSESSYFLLCLLLILSIGRRKQTYGLFSYIVWCVVELLDGKIKSSDRYAECSRGETVLIDHFGDQLKSNTELFRW